MQSKWLPIALAAVFAIIAAVAAIFVANAQTTDKLSKVDTNIPLWGIQPGLGTVMIEYGQRFGNIWYAADAANWDMVTYQINEMLEIQETGETTRPARADALKKFEDANLTPLMNAAKAKDKAAFVDAYDKAITGCNKCHGDQKDASGKPFTFVKIQRPTAPTLNDVDWKGQ